MRALIIVDVQNDFCKGGALAVPDADAIVPLINQVARRFDVVVTTQDWHPANHGSFASNTPGAKPFDMGTLAGRPQVLWPTHCVQGTAGAAFHGELVVNGKNFVKGTRWDADSYSGFFDDDGGSTGLDEYLKERGVAKVFVCGLATDYCVKATAEDAVKQGYATAVIADLCRGVNLQPGDSEAALAKLGQKGVGIIRERDV